MRQLSRTFSLVLCALFASGVGAADFVPRVIRTHPHEASAFTQGLVFDRGLLYESTGRYGHSTLSVRDLNTGRLLRHRHLPNTSFGEGIALVGDEIFQLTWKEHRVFVYDRVNLRLKRTLPYAREGWGLSYDGRHLIASDGSAQLRFLDPTTLREVRRIEVKEGDQLIDQLNELEYVKGEILANRYGYDRIARVSPQTGQVIAWMELSHLYPQQLRSSREAVLNGIAYDAVRGELIVTG